MACGIFVLRPGIEPMLPTAEEQKALITGSSGKSQSDHFLTLNFSGSRSCCTLSLKKKKKQKQDHLDAAIDLRKTLTF